jgi:hypothetical protein
MPPEAAEFFIDRCLGSKVIAEALAAHGFTVHVHDDHFPQDCKDEDWLLDVGQRGWVVLSKDGRIERRHLEIEALKSAGVAACVHRDLDRPGWSADGRGHRQGHVAHPEAPRQPHPTSPRADLPLRGGDGVARSTPRRCPPRALTT